MIMRHLTVEDSDIIEAVGFQVTAVLKSTPVGALEVVFKKTPDVVYRYADVPLFDFVVLIGAESMGSAFHEMFRKTEHPFTKSRRAKPTLKK
jgi:hypothetical protein